jgi:hypothetical protein
MHSINLIRLYAGDTDPRTPALPTRPAERQTTGSLARLDSAKRRAIRQELDEETQKRVAMKPRTVEIMTYRRHEQSEPDALMLISAAVEAFYAAYRRLPYSATVSSLNLVEYALKTRESQCYYARIGNVRRPVRLSSLPGMDMDIVVLEG